MVELSSSMKRVASPPLAPIERPIDREHLSRMTLGERELERELLDLFGRQADMLVSRMRQAPAAVIAASAHTLKGSAQGIGAWSLAHAAENLERLATLGRTDCGPAIDALAASIAEVRAAIRELLRAH